jgi:hypothetical protein
VLFAGYGMEHRLRDRWFLAWGTQARWVWVFRDTQRQVRLGLRPTVVLGKGHVLSLELLGWIIHRDERQFGNHLPRVSPVAAVNLDYGWLGRRRVGPWVRVHYSSGFRSGEAPVYELREEAVNNHYGELLLGLRAGI